MTTSVIVDIVILTDTFDYLATLQQLFFKEEKH